MRGFGFTHFEGTASTRVQTPIVVEVEADESENGEVEEHIPTRNQTTVAVKCVTKIVTGLDLF
jgi:hypothetical protein